MTLNVPGIWGEILGIAGGALVLLLFAVPLALPQRTRTLSGSRGHRDDEAEDGDEEMVRPDGYIDSFAGVIEEAGGALPPVVRLAFVGIVLWWLIYLIVNWSIR